MTESQAPAMAEPIPLPFTIPPGPMTKSLREQIESHIAEMIPKGKRGVVIGVADRDGMRIGTAVKIGENWKLGGDVQRKWGGDVSGDLYVVGSW